MAFSPDEVQEMLGEIHKTFDRWEVLDFSVEQMVIIASGVIVGIVAGADPDERDALLADIARRIKLGVEEQCR